METSIAYTDYENAVISSDEQKWHRRIRKLKEEYPDLVRIKNEPENNDGNMVAEIPTKWVRVKGIGPRRKVNMTDEQKNEATERLRKYREDSQDTEEDD